MTDQELKDIAARCEKATEGTWDHTLNEHKTSKVYLTIKEAGFLPIAEVQVKQDADFIAHARTDIPALIEALKQEREKVESRDKVICDNCPNTGNHCNTCRYKHNQPITPPK